ncbi:unnamed protein product [Rhizoctonia solani]|uniref:NACHT domain-containing protein n=1 Tax=Rhizoctonia solani TaxID=456999 RepID=A0A8H2XTV0_9AGAM|nr:unnamed protein product [Rhizoctonia solani]
MNIIRKISRSGRKFQGFLANEFQNESTASLPPSSSPEKAPNPAPCAGTTPPKIKPVASNSLRVPAGTLRPLIYSSHFAAASAISLPFFIDKHDQACILSPTQTAFQHNIFQDDNSCLGSQDVAWSGLKKLLQVLEVSADLFGPFKGIIEGLNECITIYERTAEGREAYYVLRADLNKLLGDLAVHISSDPNLMTNSIFSLWRAIEAEIKLITNKQQRGKMAHITANSNHDSDEILEGYRRIHDHVGRLAMNTNLSLWKTVDKYVMESRLDKLAASKFAPYNAGLSVGVARGPCAPDTRLEEIDNLLLWANKPDGEGVCWLNGMAGTGKTTIAYSLCHRLDEDRRLAASFYCSRAMGECKDVRMILPTIAYQLARFSYPFQSALSAALSKDPDAATRELELQFRTLIAGPLDQARAAIPPGCVVVIDALDECEDENSIGKLLKVLLSSHHTLPIRFLVSSRPEPEIHKQMTTGSHSRLVLHELSNSTVQHDIGKYLDRELQGIPLEDSERTNLIEQCGVLFIYASTAARYIKDGYELEEHKERLGTILGLTNTDSETNQEIDELYLMILGTAWSYSKFNAANKEQMKILLDTIVCAQEPMTLDALAGVLDLKDGDRVNALLRPLCSVIHVADDTGLVSALHASFPDFLFNHRRSHHFSCAAAKRHCDLAQACFKAIKSSPIQFNIGGLPSSYVLDHTIPEYRTKKPISASLVYACRHWAAHLQIGTPEKEAGLLLSLEDFLSARLLLWMEVLNLKKLMCEGVAIMQRIVGWCQAQDLSSDTIELANDAWQFVSTYANHPVSQSTPHIYVSMLAFWPPLRPISTHYMSRTHQIPHPLGQAVTQRNPSLLATWSFDQPVGSTRFSPNGKWIILAAGRHVYILDRYTGQTVLDSLEAHTAAVNSVAFAPDSSYALSGSDDGTICRWIPMNNCESPNPLIKHNAPILSFGISPDGTRIVLSLGTNSVCIHAAHDGRQLLNLALPNVKRIGSVGFTHDGAQVVCGSDDKTISIWDSRRGDAICDPLHGHTDSICSVISSPSEPILISGSRDATIRIWSSRDGQILKGPFKGHTHSVSSVAVSSDGLLIASGSEDCTARIWDTQTGETVIGPLVGHIKAIHSVSFSPHGTQLITGSQDGTIRLWNVPRRDKRSKPSRSLTDSIRSARISPDGTYVASGSEIGTIRLWSTQDGQVFGNPLKGHIDWIHSIDVSPDGAYIVSGSKDKSLRLWDTQTGQVVHGPITGHSAAINSVRFSPDGSQVVSGSDDCTVRLWNIKDGLQAMAPLEGHTDMVLSVAFSPNGKQVASASHDRTIRVWNLKSDKPYSIVLKGHRDFVVSVHFSPDGSRLVSGSYDKSIIIWDTSTGKALVGPLQGHRDRVTAVAFSPNGRFVASGSYDSGICLWDPESGKLVAGPLEGHVDYIEGLQFSPNSSQILSYSSDRTIRFWDVERLQSVSLPERSREGTNYEHSTHENTNLSSWRLDDDGWVVDALNHKLAWVPPDLRIYLLRPANDLIISDKGCFKLDFEETNIGEEWIKCYSFT